jgi:hypothetical protein
MDRPPCNPPDESLILGHSLMENVYLWNILTNLILFSVLETNLILLLFLNPSTFGGLIALHAAEARSFIVFERYLVV